MKTTEGLSICIVDDDKLSLESLTHSLKEGIKNIIKIRSFHTGEEFLKSVPEQKPDIVILDYMLNGLQPYAMDGLAVLKKIKQAYPEITVIMLSGQDKIEVALESIKDGAYDYIIKNDTVFLKMKNILKNVITSVLASKRLKNNKRWLTRAIVSFIVVMIAAILLKYS